MKIQKDLVENQKLNNAYKSETIQLQKSLKIKKKM